MKKILFAAFAALSMIACNKDDATTVIPDIDNTLNGEIFAHKSACNNKSTDKKQESSNKWQNIISK